MKAVLLLADAAQTDQQSKISALGLGWTRIGLPSRPMAVVLLVDLSLDEVVSAGGLDGPGLNAVIELYLADGSPVLVDGPSGDKVPFFVRAQTSPLDPSELLDPDMFIRIPVAIQIGNGLLSSTGAHFFRATASYGDIEATAEEHFSVIVAPQDGQ